ncbi:MAG: hypothetical protein K2M11_00085 [Paramuribaculum sp.]|nr:hypothetical protein [Paramuribaculum sp.]
MKRESRQSHDRQPRPKESTLIILRQFARCCKSDKRLAMPLRILNLN